VRSCSDVHNLLTESGVAHEIVQLPATSKSARRAAELLGVTQAEVVKSLVFLLDGEATLLLVPGDCLASDDLVRATVGCEEVALAKGPKVLELTGYRVGAVPPFALACTLPVVADSRVFEQEVVYCGGGTTTTMVKIRSEYLRALVQPTVGEIAEVERD